MKGEIMNALGRIGAILIAICAVITGAVGLMVFGPFLLMILVPILLIAGVVWILRQFRNKDRNVQNSK